MDQFYGQKNQPIIINNKFDNKMNYNNSKHLIDNINIIEKM